MTAITQSQNVAKMKYVVQCFISDTTGRSVRITNYKSQQLDLAYTKACEFYGHVLPCPDNGRYQDYTV